MTSIFERCVLALILFVPLGSEVATAEGLLPSDVIARLVADASKKPPGPVENAITAQSVKGASAAQQAFWPKKSVREVIADEYNTIVIEGPFKAVYAEGPAAIFLSKVKMNPRALAKEKNLEEDGECSVAFSESGGGGMFVGPKIHDDGQIIATFCLVMQKGAWKVHCAYFSDVPLKDADLNFVERQLSDFAKKQ